MIAHIVAPSSVPWYASWLASLVMFGGVLMAAAWWRVRLRRRTGFTLMSIGFLATVAMLSLQPSVPISPGYGIRLAGGAESTSPVLMRVCAVRTGTTVPAVPGSGRILLVLVDGRQVAELRSDTVVVPMASGRHRVSAQLLTADHRAFVPPVATDATVSVAGPGPVAQPPTCNH